MGFMCSSVMYITLCSYYIPTINTILLNSLCWQNYFTDIFVDDDMHLKGNLLNISKLQTDLF